MNHHFKVGHYKSLEREKEDEKNVEESKETDEEKEHTTEKDDITQLAQGPRKESGTSDKKDETRRRLCDLGTWLGRVNELIDREKYMALTDPFVPPRHFKFPVRTEYGKERRCQESYLIEFDGVAIHKAWTLFCANAVSLWVAVRRTYVFTLQEVEKICLTLQSHVILVWTIRSKTASCFKPQVAIFQLRSFYKLHKGFT